MTSILDEHEFALCLTHDVDRPYKTYQGLYYSLVNRDPSQLRSLFTDERPYWNFERIMALEDELGVRSSFYFLQEKRLFREKRPRSWIRPKNWSLFTGRYDVRDEEILEVIRALDRGGWEVGLHGSYDTADEPDRLRHEKELLEDVLGDRITGGRQHYLRMDGHRTWNEYRSLGLKYDSSLGSNYGYGFHGCYDVLRPFDDEFVVFPLTIMDRPLMNITESVDHAWQECERLLSESAANDAIMTVLWHPQYMNPDEFPGYLSLYRRFIERAKEMNAWIGPCERCYERLQGE